MSMTVIPVGKKLLLSTTVIPKFYIRDAVYQSIDAVKTVTFNQAATFTKGSLSGEGFR